MEAELYDNLPKHIQDVINTFDIDAPLYEECDRVSKELKSNGIESDYDLSGEITDVYPPTNKTVLIGYGADKKIIPIIDNKEIVFHAMPLGIDKDEIRKVVDFFNVNENNVIILADFPKPSEPRIPESVQLELVNYRVTQPYYHFEDDKPKYPTKRNWKRKTRKYKRK